MERADHRYARAGGAEGIVMPHLDSILYLNCIYTKLLLVMKNIKKDTKLCRGGYNQRKNTIFS
jgi:hypothetical protein